MSLPDELAEQLLGAIIDGTYPPGTALPSEPELAELFSISRLTVREAIKALRVQNVVRIQRGLGTYVNTPDRWTSLEPLIRATTSRGPADSDLLDARRILQAGAAELAAVNRTGEDLARLRAHLQELRSAPDAAAFSAADQAFHRAIMSASGNSYLPLMFEPFAKIDADRDARRHEQVLAALEAGDPVRAREAMNGAAATRSEGEPA
ncbi:FadR/GntR family transcriptional regulator [Saccharopolyspora halophila]|uniref:FadR/GntR family transcriptional regulator n=1 Tax=Saccharopolyspora halophila TaxID=405551 RepID=A0ABP5TVQ6_9PSEU